MLSSFLFSSRRRHTRLQGDWSSDVCSSDLELIPLLLSQKHPQFEVIVVNDRSNDGTYDYLREEIKKHARLRTVNIDKTRSEERRVGKECKSLKAPNI